ncbi:MAG: methyltransferase [Candidatus Omnitrophica bacterium]|nr:methyltransferase [Candidatus Omnitrophota bacterium]MDD5671889.1 methyltransferase [Candidatus Omnitrophota bacterium]
MHRNQHTLTKERLVFAVKNYAANLLLIWPVIALYRYNPYYVKLLRPEAQTVLLWLALAYTVGAFIYYLYSLFVPRENGPESESKGLIILRGLRKYAKRIRHYLGTFTSYPALPLPKLEKREKTAVLFAIIKIYYLPLMLHYCFNNYYAFQKDLARIDFSQFRFQPEFFSNALSPALVPLVFMIDTAYFGFGYAFEAGFLRNKVKSVEPTVLGWTVALVCYLPFSGIFAGYIGWRVGSEMVTAATPLLTFLMRTVIILLLFIYLWATLALGTKCSNLTNRGIVTGGPYAFVRHPAYIAKNLVWWVASVTVMNAAVFFSICVWSFIYFLRAITEERHLIADPDYQAYCRTVKWRFVPGVY